MGKRPTAEMEQLQDLVEGGRIACSGRHDREDPRQVAVEAITRQERLPGAHPIPVACECVDLAVVRDEAVGVSKGPRGKRVRREPAVHHRDPALEPLVGEVREEPSQLLGRQHPLVDDRPCRQRREVDARACVLHALAHDKALALEGVANQRGPARGGEEDLREPRGDGPGSLAGGGEVDRHLAPSQDDETFLAGESRNEIGGPLSCSRLARKKRHPSAVAPRRREIEACNLRIEPMRQLYQRTRPVTGAGVSPERAPVSEVLERSEPERHDAVAGRALQVHNERDPARIVLERGVVAAHHVFGPGHWRPLGGRSRPGDHLGPRVGLVSGSAVRLLCRRLMAGTPLAQRMTRDNTRKSNGPQYPPEHRGCRPRSRRLVSDRVGADLPAVGHVLGELGSIPVTQLMASTGIRQPRPRRRWRQRHGRRRSCGRAGHARRSQPGKDPSLRRSCVPTSRWWRSAVAGRWRLPSAGSRRVPSLRRALAPLARRRCVPALRRTAFGVVRARAPARVTSGPARGPRLGPCGEARDQVHDDADEREKEKKNGPHARRHSPWSDAAGPLVAFRKEIAHGSQGDAQHQTVHEGRAGVNDGQADELLNVHTSSVTAYCTAAANLSSTTG